MTPPSKIQAFYRSDEAITLLTVWLPCIAFCAVVGYFFWFLYAHAINVPFHDDIFDLLNIVNRAAQSESFADWAAILHEPYNDHRTSATRLLVYVSYLLSGQVDFRTLTYVANLALPLILLLFYFVVRKDQLRWVWLLIAALIFLNMRLYKLALHVQASFAFLYVYVYAFAGLFALHRVTPAKFILAVLFCALSTFTLASGKIVWLLGLASLIQQSFILKQRSYLYPLLWLIVSVVLITIWQMGFEKLLYAYNDALGLGERLYQYGELFLVILGSAVTNTSTMFAAIVGTLVFATLLVQSLLSIKKADVRLLLCGWFAALSAAATVIGRAAVVNSEYLLHERYAINSIILISCLLVILFLQSRKRRASVICITLALSGVYWNWSYGQFEDKLDELLEIRYEEFNKDRYLQVFRKPEASNGVVRESIQSGIYRPPCRPLPSCL